MAEIDFTYFYKEKFSCLTEIECFDYDILISTFNQTERVCDVFKTIHSKKKYLIVLPEYKDNSFTLFEDTECVKIEYNGYSELVSFFNSLPINNSTKLCIDITGFITPHMLFIMRYLQKKEIINRLDVLYSEPSKYVYEENTDFSDCFYDVSQIYGYGGTPSPNMNNDLLIIASGYDNSRITDVASKKRYANKKQLLGFPPLQADMFQENMLKAYRAEASVGIEGFKNLELNLYAPANDPFVAAQAIKDYIDREQRIKPFTNIYLAPISTKPHALGMAIYYLLENSNGDKPISIIYPNCEKYYGNTSVGISKIWKYEIELIIE